MAIVDDQIYFVLGNDTDGWLANVGSDGGFWIVGSADGKGKLIQSTKQEAMKLLAKNLEEYLRNTGYKPTNFHVLCRPGFERN